jgi:hypothetical protein
LSVGLRATGEAERSLSDSSWFVVEASKQSALVWGSEQENGWIKKVAIVIVG